ncbi:MAG TPA: ABC transporter permease [Paracoccaceae bacterium]|nr:ABC transporter permease [Paracoccaceae bacterium]
MRRGWLSWYALAYLVFLYLPVLLLPLFSVNESATPRFPMTGFTWKWYAGLWTNEAMHGAAWNSLVVATASALLATLIGIGAGRAVTRYPFAGRRPVTALIMAPLILPEIIIAISLLIVFLGAGLPLSLFTIILGHVLLCVPYAMSVLVSGFEGFDRSLEEASADLGESPWGTFRRVTLPMVWPAILSSLLVSFTISLDEFILAFFLAGTEATLPVYIWGQLRFAARLPNVLALGTILLAASILMLVAAEALRRRAQARVGGGLVHG